MRLKKFLFVLVVIVLVASFNSILALFVVYVGPSPDNSSVLSEDSVYINVSSSDEGGDHYVFTDFDNDLILWLRMENIQYGFPPVYVFDNSSHANIFYRTGGVVFNDTGYWGNASWYDSSGQYLSNINNDDFRGDNMTLSLWFLSRDTSVLKWLVGIGSGSGDRYNLGYSSGYIFAYDQIAGPADSDPYPSLTISNNVWYHLAVVFASDGNKTFYLNGVSADDVDVGAPLSSLTAGTTDMLVGEGIGTATVWNGSIDEIMLFNRSLTDIEILALYNATATPYEHNFTDLSEGSHSFMIASGNKSGFITTETRTVSVDTIVPTVAFEDPTPADGSSVNNVSINFSASDEAHDVYSFLDFDRSLIAWWSGDSVSGANIYDNSSYGHTATNVGDVSFTSGKFGDAMHFDGTDNSYATIPASVFQNLTGDFTLATWVKFDSFQTPWDMILGARTSATASGFFWAVTNSPSTRQKFYINNGTSGSEKNYQALSSYNTDTWYHLAVKKKDNFLYFYSDGSPVAMHNLGNDFVFQPDGAEAEIGAEHNVNVAEFNGSMDEILIFNRALNDDEIASLFNYTSPVYTEIDEKDIGQYNYTLYSVDEGGNFNATLRNMTGAASSLHLLGVNYTLDNLTKDITLSAKTTYWIYNKSDLYNNSDLTYVAEYRIDEGPWINFSNTNYLPAFNSSDWSGVYGDSITSNYQGTWLVYFEELYGSDFFHKNLQNGTGGAKCAKIRAEIANGENVINGTDLILQCGTNDLYNANASGSIDDIVSDYMGIFSDLRARNISIYLVNILPYSNEDFCDEIQGVNAWLYNYYLENNSDGFIKGFADVYNTSLKDSSACTIESNYSDDGTHPNAAGARIYGTTVFEQAFKRKYLDGVFANFTATSKGEYDLRINITNPENESLIYIYNNVINLADSFSPLVVSSSPVNGTITANSSVLFQFNVTDDVDVSNCSLFIDSTEYANSSAISLEDTNTILASVSPGTYEWIINCTDSSNNVGMSESRSLTISSSSVVENVISSKKSFSAVANNWVNTYLYYDKELSDAGPLNRNLLEKGRVKIKVGRDVHYVGVKEIKEGEVLIEVSSAPQEAILKIGKEKKFEITDDEYYDLSVVLHGISDKLANITISGIHELIPVEDSSDNEKIGFIEKEEEELVEDFGSKDVSESYFIQIVLTVVVFGIIVFFVVWSLRKKKKRKHLN